MRVSAVVIGRAGGEPGSSLYRLLAGRIRSDGRGFAPVAHLRDGPSMRPERCVVAPAGAKGLLVVSMCQMASVSLRAMSTRATDGPALAAQPGLGALVAGGVDRVAGGVDGRLDQRPAQVLRAVLGQRAAPVVPAGLVHRRAQAGVADQLLRLSGTG